MLALWIVLYVLAALCVASIVISWKISGMLLHPKIWDYSTVVDEEEKRGSFTRAWFESECHLEEFSLRSNYGYDLHCALWPRAEGVSFADGRRRVAVIVHGYTYCLLGSVKYARIFHDLGFDCVLYDHRNHGLSGKAPPQWDVTNRAIFRLSALGRWTGLEATRSSAPTANPWARQRS